MPYHVVICPDSFKGSLSASEAATAMAEGVRRSLPDTRITCLPMADGGEGTAECMMQFYLGHLGQYGRWQHNRVRAPDGAPIDAKWGWIATQHLAVIEVASACGLNLIAPPQRDPWRLDTRGVGELILHALDLGAQKILLGLGGSGTNDAGAGMLAALGVQFLDRNGQVLIPTPEGLETLDRVDDSKLDTRLDQVELICLTDVDNPLNGPQGASTIFGPQKGLKPGDIPAMDTRLTQIARCIEAHRPLHCPSTAPGMGAAGGLGFALSAVLGAARLPGAYTLANLIGLDEAIEQADLVLTGEGALDHQTARGKVVAEVGKRAKSLGKPAIAIAGRVLATPRELAQMGLQRALSLCTPTIDDRDAIMRAHELIVERTSEAILGWG